MNLYEGALILVTFFLLLFLIYIGLKQVGAFHSSKQESKK